MNVAAIDIGTNSTRLLIADDQGHWIDRRAVVTRLGQGVDADGAFGIEPMERTWAVLTSYAQAVQQLEVHRVRAVATSAARDASNRDEFLGRAKEILGVEPEVISGEEEAALAFKGARAGFAEEPAPFAVVDVGGGSTEIAVGDAAPTYGHSFDIGSVRMSERLAPDRPMPEAQFATAQSWARSVFADIDARPAAIVGVAGTFTSLAGIHLDLDHYRPDLIEGTAISLHDMWRMAGELAAMTTDAIAAYPSVDPARAYVLPAGTIVAAAAVESLGGTSVRVSEHDNLDGIVAGLLGS